MGRGQTDKQTSRLLDRIGPVGRFGENASVDMITNTIYLVSLKLKLAVLCQNWKKNNCFWLLNISAPLDGIVGSKDVDKTLLEVSAKKGEAKSKKEHHRF